MVGNCFADWGGVESSYHPAGKDIGVNRRYVILLQEADEFNFSPCLAIFVTNGSFLFKGNNDTWTSNHIFFIFFLFENKDLVNKVKVFHHVSDRMSHGVMFI